MITRLVQSFIQIVKECVITSPLSQVQPYAGNRQSSVSLPLRPVIVFITGQDFQGQFLDNFFWSNDCTKLFISYQRVRLTWAGPD